MAPGSIVQAVEEFISLNQRFTACGLEDDAHQRWSTLAHALDGAALRQAARHHAGESSRRHARAPVCLGVRFLEPALAGEGRTQDLSCGGCAVELGVELTRGSEVELVLALPDPLGGLRIDGWVCWVTPARRAGHYRAGVTFASLTPRERDLLASCVLADVAPRLSRRA